MEERYKNIELREDGFLEVTLQHLNDFDDYIYQQMQKDRGCLACVRDPRIKSKLYYDTKGYVSLRMYMLSHIFEKRESTAFLIFVLEQMIQVNTTKPVCMNLDYMYVSSDGSMLQFLVIPVAVEQWVFQKEESRQFLQQLIQEMRITEGYEAIGYLAYAQHHDELTLPMVLQGLHDLQAQEQVKPSFLERIFHLHEDTTYIISDVPQPHAYPSLFMGQEVMEEASKYPKQESFKEDVHNETVVLFQREPSAYLEDMEAMQSISLDKEQFHIGRALDNDLCISESHVSLYHACYDRQSEELEDLSSSNGTFVNEIRIKRIKLHDLDEILFAKRRYQYHNR